MKRFFRYDCVLFVLISANRRKQSVDSVSSSSASRVWCYHPCTEFLVSHLIPFDEFFTVLQGLGHLDRFEGDSVGRGGRRSGPASRSRRHRWRAPSAHHLTTSQQPTHKQTRFQTRSCSFISALLCEKLLVFLKHHDRKTTRQLTPVNSTKGANDTFAGSPFFRLDFFCLLDDNLHRLAQSTALLLLLLLLFACYQVLRQQRMTKIQHSRAEPTPRGLRLVNKTNKTCLPTSRERNSWKNNQSLKNS
ncbi:hypothetical protein TcasGA2_TC007798 [Tribolium castaneum]|uniref:Uncharacterized protein n=1 Tax=Tribolium castaneum TaxID=7070 RepID=D2A1Z0_TRICA|nr:hypothetical protein TcasGA2_TC007798 [Tribolium castaneum]